MKKKTSLILLIAVFSIAFIQCKSQKESNIKTSEYKITNYFQKSVPFKITSATYQNWVGGKPGSNGATISFTTENLYVNLESVYFRGQVTNLVYEKHNKKMQYVGKISSSLQGDLVLHKDEKNELGNKPPKQQKKIPFELKDNEAVVSYTVNGEKLFFKIEDVQELKTIFHQ